MYQRYLNLKKIDFKTKRKESIHNTSDWGSEGKHDETGSQLGQDIQGLVGFQKGEVEERS